MGFELLIPTILIAAMLCGGDGNGEPGGNSWQPTTVFLLYIVHSFEINDRRTRGPLCGGAIYTSSRQVK